MRIIKFFISAIIMAANKFMLSSRAEDLERAVALEHYDFDESYENDFEEEQFESFEETFESEFENLTRRKGMKAAPARQAALRKVGAVHGAKAQSALNRKMSLGLISGVSPRGIKGNVTAMFNITITRRTSNIASPINVPLFGGTHRESLYNAVVTQFPSSGRITAINTTVTGNYEVTYSDGVNTDIVDIICEQLPYATFLDMSKFQKFRVTNNRYSLANTAQVAQFRSLYAIVSKKLFGTSNVNQLNINQFISPTQFQNTVVDVQATYDFDIDTCLIAGIIQGATTSTPVSFTFGMFVSSFDKSARSN